MKPPAPVTTTRSFLDIDGPFTRREGFYPVFQRLAKWATRTLWAAAAGLGPGRKAARLPAGRIPVKSPDDVVLGRERMWEVAEIRVVQAKKLPYTSHIAPFCRQGAVLADLVPLTLEQCPVSWNQVTGISCSRTYRTRARPSVRLIPVGRNVL